MRICQTSLNFNGGLWPSSLPLFHGFVRPSGFVVASMNGSFLVEKKLHVRIPERRIATQSGPSTLVVVGRSFRRSGQFMQKQNLGPGGQRSLGPGGQRSKANILS